MVKEIEKWWDDSSKYFQKDAKIPTSSAHWGVHAPDESKLNLLGNVKGKKILEVGCGGGQNSIALTKRGATCTGIDISKEQLKYAENLAKKEKVKVKFLKCNFQNLHRFKQNSFDIAISAWAFQYSPDLKKLFREVYRILKKNGLFVFSLPHPFHDLINVKTYKIEKSYLKTGRHEEVETWPDKSKHKFIWYSVKISDVYNDLLEVGFFVEKILELLDTNQQTLKKYYPQELSKLICPTIIFKTRKIIKVKV